MNGLLYVRLLRLYLKLGLFVGVVVMMIVVVLDLHSTTKGCVGNVSTIHIPCAMHVKSFGVWGVDRGI